MKLPIRTTPVMAGKNQNETTAATSMILSAFTCGLVSTLNADCSGLRSRNSFALR